MRTAPGLIAVLATLLCAAPVVEAAPCNAKRGCKAAKAKKQQRPGTGWINGTYNGGPGDPVLAPLPSLPG